jgi:hypothetical protein
MPANENFLDTPLVKHNKKVRRILATSAWGSPGGQGRNGYNPLISFIFRRIKARQFTHPWPSLPTLFAVKTTDPRR